MHIEKLSDRFPIGLAKDLKFIESEIYLSSMHESYMPFDIQFEKNTLTIPTRIYTDEGQLGRLAKLTPKQQEVIYCVFSRHHDGFVREKCLRQFVTSNNSFTAPYILQLLGEYVVEIIEVIYQNREKINKDNLVRYISENPLHYEQTRQRVYSYWDCYYRRAYPKYKRGVSPKDDSYLDYPGIKMVKYINALLSSTKL
ncbi:hypothetical protein HJP15_16265 [Pseudoalteromonas sp. NEC-BIFX-2020_002]|uniref:hypothetical protein n=1 Tax=Pseudoalteromonas sp. NEC-BIFX-2020_002 TaxID=2732353 RepID=UPI001477142F|nr:hypothetical protein [Pseudoalteromonas sp. NEC-BIFX-2020_002]NNG44457.1 hypothetical protein [Pseudoalteromonas sp. NEC-BIFX-2020_002]